MASSSSVSSRLKYSRQARSSPLAPLASRLTRVLRRARAGISPASPILGSGAIPLSLLGLPASPACHSARLQLGDARDRGSIGRRKGHLAARDARAVEPSCQVAVVLRAPHRYRDQRDSEIVSPSCRDAQWLGE